MHGASDISHSEGWPLSHREKACWERKSPMPEERACIPDNWLCISDWQITHRLVFGQSAERARERKGRGMWQVHTFHSSWKNTKHCDPMFDVAERQCLYWNKNRLSHNRPHQNTYTHIHGGSHREYCCSWLRLFWLKSVRGEASPRYMFPSKSLYFRLTIHLFLITDLFFCHAGSNADEPT